MNGIYAWARRLAALMLVVAAPANAAAAERAAIWTTYEHEFISTRDYENPLYDLREFTVTFTSPTGAVKNIRGFFDGGRSWKVRFSPDETGSWTFTTRSSDTLNTGLHGRSGGFECIPNNNPLAIYSKGGITHPDGTYYLAHADGTPFFWTACTAWNGPLLSTEEEWEAYLSHRARHGYNVIQFVTTQWRGCAANRFGETAFEGSGRIKLNVSFFKRLDEKFDRVNAHGLVAAPVLLWALQWASGRELSPGYYLPQEEAILLARYMVARYGGHHVIWMLGGDGKYTAEYEQRWKNIGRGVFGDEHPGLVTTHPSGYWYGNIYAEEDWIDIIGLQSSHSNSQRTVEYITKGPFSREWDRLRPRPLINLEPNYEEIFFKITAEDVRNASYWSIFSAPPAGISYGANGIWPWLREGENILNHEDAKGTTSWDKSIDFPGSMQIGYLAGFVRGLEWWRLKPAQDILMEQPGDAVFNHFISVAKSDNHDLIVAYTPVRQTIRLWNKLNVPYSAEWFNPATNDRGDAAIVQKNGMLEALPPAEGDFVLVLRKKE